MAGHCREQRVGHGPHQGHRVRHLERGVFRLREQGAGGVVAYRLELSVRDTQIAAAGSIDVYSEGAADQPRHADIQ